MDHVFTFESVQQVPARFAVRLFHLHMDFAPVAYFDVCLCIIDQILCMFKDSFCRGSHKFYYHFIPSGRSVFSRITNVGLFKDGASSWMPPESVRII